MSLMTARFTWNLTYRLLNSKVFISGSPPVQSSSLSPSQKGVKDA